MRVEGDDGLAIGLQNINCSVIRGELKSYVIKDMLEKR